MSREPKELRASGVAKKRSGIHLIAEMAKVSIGTVDRALHARGGIKDSTRQRILQVARQRAKKKSEKEVQSHEVPD